MGQATRTSSPIKPSALLPRSCPTTHQSRLLVTPSSFNLRNLSYSFFTSKLRNPVEISAHGNMAKLSLLLGAGLLMAIAGLSSGASALKPINQPKPSALSACGAKDGVQPVQLNYDQDQVYEVYVPLNGESHTLSVDSNLPQLECTYVDLGTCRQENCAANPITLQVLDPSGSTACILEYPTPDGTKHRTLSGKSSPSKLPPGWTGTISCHRKSTLPLSAERNLQHRETTSSNTPSLNTTALDGLDGCIGRSDDPTVQRIDWYRADDTRYTLFINRNEKPNTMEPPQVKCAYQQPGGVWACGPCNKRFEKFDIDTRDTICQILMGRGDGGARRAAIRTRSRAGRTRTRPRSWRDCMLGDVEVAIWGLGLGLGLCNGSSRLLSSCRRRR